MIFDLHRFVEQETPVWEELEQVLARIEADPAARLDLAQARRFHYLYERTSGDLVRVAGRVAHEELQQYLEALVSRAYGEIHETRRWQRGESPARWLRVTFPVTFRRHLAKFTLSFAVTLAGATLGGLLLGVDPSMREVLFPFPGLDQSPAERVAREESRVDDELAGRKTQGAAWYMTHNTRVSLSTAAMGATWGIGTILMLFLNGFLLGAVMIDYIAAGHWQFLLGWLLPHGSVEIPAILIAGQAGLLLADAILARGRRAPLAERLRAVAGDLLTLLAGMALLLVWAGIVEAFLSQYHWPTLPYALKIAFGAIQTALLTVYLWRSGRRDPSAAPDLAVRPPEAEGVAP